MYFIYGSMTQILVAVSSNNELDSVFTAAITQRRRNRFILHRDCRCGTVIKNPSDWYREVWKPTVVLHGPFFLKLEHESWREPNAVSEAQNNHM